MAKVQPQEMQTAAGVQNPLPVPMRACEECRRKKTKCDMTRPVCGLCKRTLSRCHFPSRRQTPARPSKRQKTDAAGPLDYNLTWLLNLIANSDTTQLHGGSAQELVAWRRSSNPQVRATSLSGSSMEQIMDQNGIETPAQHLRPRSELSLPEQAASEPIPYGLAMDLVEAFFAHVQPWLPAFHKPRFMQKCAGSLQKTSDSLRHSSLEMKLLLNSMFALSARFSPSPYLASIRPLDRDARFKNAANEAYAAMRGSKDPSLTYLQGCILLAFHAYTSEFNSPAWILTGVCVRLAYDLGLSEIDDDTLEAGQGNDHVTIEEMRRAWWLTWELDTFGSIIRHRPFAIDRQCLTVNLPIADVDWFNERFVQSSPLGTSLDQEWTSLQELENQNPRAWFLRANHLLSMLFMHLKRKRGDVGEDMSSFEKAFTCLRLSLPHAFYIRPGFEANNFADCNWIMGTHLILMSAFSTIASISASEACKTSPLLDLDHSSDDSIRVRALALSQLIGRWPVEHMTAAHPFFVSMLLPIQLGMAAPGFHPRSWLEGTEQMVELILMQFAKMWKLGGDMLDILHEIGKSGTENTTDSVSLRRRFPVYFPRKTSADARRDTTVTPIQNPALCELQETAFDYRYFLASPQEQAITGEVERSLESDFDEANQDMQNQELHGFHFSPSIPLLEMMHGRSI